MDNKENSNNNNLILDLLEIKLKDISDKLLLSKINDDENILINVHQVIDEVFIRSAMEIANNNVSRASKLLGINRNTLAKRLKHMGNGAFKKPHSHSA